MHTPPDLSSDFYKKCINEISQEMVLQAGNEKRNEVEWVISRNGNYIKLWI